MELAVSTSSATPKARLRDYFRALRPKQWTKNGLLTVPLVFARQLFDAEQATRTLFAVLAFSALASTVYLANDWYDREEDRRHPTKCKRPIARGLIGGAQVFGIAALLIAFVVTVGLWLGSKFLGLLVAYAVIQVAYTLYLKHHVIVDVFAIAMGFILRIAAGAAAIDVPVSNWLFLCTLLFSLFLGFAKRRAELVTLEDDAESHRKNLGEYSLSVLDQFMSITASGALISYGIYTVSAETIEHLNTEALKYTVPFVAFGLFRYIDLVHRKNAGGAPEQVLWRDRPIQLAILGYVVAVGIAIYLSS